MLPTDDELPDTTNNGGAIPFDARQGRSKLLLNLTVGVLNSFNAGDYQGQLKGLQSIHYLCFPYIETKDSEKIKEAISQLRFWINNKGSQRDFISNELDKVTELVFLTYKDQFMQLMAKTDDAYDPSGVLE